jgi:hypothetical protein
MAACDRAETKPKVKKTAPHIADSPRYKICGYALMACTGCVCAGSFEALVEDLRTLLRVAYQRNKSPSPVISDKRALPYNGPVSGLLAGRRSPILDPLNIRVVGLSYSKGKTATVSDLHRLRPRVLPVLNLRMPIGKTEPAAVGVQRTGTILPRLPTPGIHCNSEGRIVNAVRTFINQHPQIRRRGPNHV